jgi:glycosyltransferase involved in cell wall biosynthesis
VGGIPEVVAGEEHGLLVEPRDARAIAQAIARLAHDRPLVMRMSAACRRRIATAFSLERSAAELSALYFMLAAAPRPRAAL